MIKYTFLLFLIIFTGCSSKQEVYITKKVYNEISKDAILEAAKTLFVLSNKDNDNRDFTIDSYRDRLEVNKVIFENDIIKINIMVDKWILDVQQLDGETRANLVLIRKDALDSEDNKDINKNVHKLFWDRIDYLLGIKDNWKFCSSYFLFNPLNMYCNGYFITNTPNHEYIIKNILISDRSHKLNTIDTVKADIFEKTDLTLDKDYNNIFDQKDDILDTKMLNPISSDNIFEIKANKVEVEDETSTTKTTEKIEEKNNQTTEELKQEEKNLNEINQMNEFKENLENIINMKASLKNTDSKSIILNSDELKENSEFDLKAKTQE